MPNFKEVQNNKVNKLVIDSTITNSCSDKCLYKKIFDVGQREVIVFIYVSYITRENTLYIFST
jgi:hypothetical protein